MMIGGDPAPVERLDPIFAASLPASGPRIARPAGGVRTWRHAEQGYLHCGPSGAGHFVKMVHNGIEYGLMAAYAEGLNVLRHANARSDRSQGRRRDRAAARARVLPLRPRHRRRRRGVAPRQRRRSWLLDLTASALVNDPALEGFTGRVSRFGRGPVDAAGRDRRRGAGPGVVGGRVRPVRLAGVGGVREQVLSAMRKEFGGHDEKAST
jgi:6-phosphogluconate dehydrogenase